MVISWVLSKHDFPRAYCVTRCRVQVTSSFHVLGEQMNTISWPIQCTFSVGWLLLEPRSNTPFDSLPIQQLPGASQSRSQSLYLWAQHCIYWTPLVLFTSLLGGWSREMTWRAMREGAAEGQTSWRCGWSDSPVWKGPRHLLAHVIIRSRNLILSGLTTLEV